MDKPRVFRHEGALAAGRLRKIEQDQWHLLIPSLI
jgi:hypothetical protein